MAVNENSIAVAQSHHVRSALLRVKMWRNIMERIYWQDGVTMLAGIVLIASLFILDFTPPEGTDLQIAIWNFAIVGLAVIVTAIAALYAYLTWVEWVALGLGLWMVASPWVLDFETIPVLKSLAVICGAIIAVMAIVVLIQKRQNDLV